MTIQGIKLLEKLNNNYFCPDVVTAIYDEVKKLLGNNTFEKTLS